jgi:hypothetical protein
MNKTRFEKLAPLSGAASVLVMMVGTGMLGVYDYLPAADRLVEIFSGNSNRIKVIGYLGLFSAVLLMWFAGSIYSALSEQEGGNGRLSMVAFGGCLASGITLGSGFSALFALGARVGAAGGINPAEAVTLYDIYGTILGQMTAFTFAVLIGAAAVIALRTAMFPTWIGWASVLIALGLVSPVGYFVLGFALVWLFGVSILLYRRGA